MEVVRHFRTHSALQADLIIYSTDSNGSVYSYLPCLALAVLERRHQTASNQTGVIRRQYFQLVGDWSQRYCPLIRLSSAIPISGAVYGAQVDGRTEVIDVMSTATGLPRISKIMAHFGPTGWSFGIQVSTCASPFLTSANCIMGKQRFISIVEDLEFKISTTEVLKCEMHYSYVRYA